MCFVSVALDLRKDVFPWDLPLPNGPGLKDLIGKWPFAISAINIWGGFIGQWVSKTFLD